MNVNNPALQPGGAAYVPLGSLSDISSGAAVLDNNLLGKNPGEFRLFSDMLDKAQERSPSGTAEAASLSTAAGKKPVDKTDKLYELCLELETFLIKNLVKGMRNTVQKSKLIDTGFAGEVYEDMLYDEYAKSYAKNAGFGLAEMAYRELAGI